MNKNIIQLSTIKITATVAILALLFGLSAVSMHNWFNIGGEEEVEKKVYLLETTVDGCKGKEGSIAWKPVEEDGDVFLQEYECKNGIWELDEIETARWRLAATKPKNPAMYWNGDCLPEAEGCVEPEHDLLTTDEVPAPDDKEPEVRCETFDCPNAKWDICFGCSCF